MKHETYRARVISFSRNFGSHAALRAGSRTPPANTYLFQLRRPPGSARADHPYERAHGPGGNDIVWAQRESTKVPLG